MLQLRRVSRRFFCFIVPDKPFVWKRLRRNDTTARVGAVAEALDSVLPQHPGLRDLRWRPENKHQE
jgi:hypothetical protein